MVSIIDHNSPCVATDVYDSLYPTIKIKLHSLFHSQAKQGGGDTFHSALRIIGTQVKFEMGDQTQHTGCFKWITAIIGCKPVKKLNAFRTRKMGSVELVK